MRSHYFIAYTQSLHAINGLIAVGRAKNLLLDAPHRWEDQIKVEIVKRGVSWTDEDEQ